MVPLLIILAAICGAGKASKRCAVDRMEFNVSHCYDPPMEQIIFWEWNERYGRYDCRGWIATGEAVIVGRNVVLFKGWRITAGSVLLTETDEDPERKHSKLLPNEFRNRMPWDAPRNWPVVEPHSILVEE